MDIITGLALACGIAFVALVVRLLVQYRTWRERRRLHTANWVLRSVANCEQGGIARSYDPMPPHDPKARGRRR